MPAARRRTFAPASSSTTSSGPTRWSTGSPEPLLDPQTLDERVGIVNDVVFPTGIDVRGEGQYDVYYGAADARIACARVDVSFGVTVR